ncbi:MAG: hypothetical protein JKY94_01890 [Rhodobacteraceae bacterium]|nr:hypothetical protein [Paracoccaceae bacterium]
MEIDELLAAAKSGADAPSDLQLSRKIKANSGQIGGWRRKFYYPRDDTLIELCELANVPPEVGLLWLNAWRADEKAKPVYEKMARDAEKRASKTRRAA